MKLELSIALLTAASLLTACSTPARRIETGGPDSIVTVGEIDDQEINDATSRMLSSLLELGVLAKAPNQPARLLIDRIVNDTSSQFPIDNLVYGIREQLVNSGKAQVNTTYGSNPETQMGQDVLRRDQFESGEVKKLQNDFVLTGRISQMKRSAGNVKQATFTFRLTLTAMSGPDTGLEVWTKQEPFTKKGTKPSVSF